MKKNYKGVSLIGIVILQCVITTFIFAQVPDTLWTKTYGGISYDHGWAVHQTADGGYIIGAETQSYGVGGWDIWLIRTDANGDTLWTKTYGTMKDENCRSLQQTFDGGYIAAGSIEYATGNIHFYLVKTDSIGDTLWTRAYAQIAVCYSVEQTTDSGYILVGAAYGGAYENIYMIRTDPVGNTLWTKVYGGGNSDWCWDVQQTIDGGYIIAGNTASFGAGSADIWLMKLDETGDTVWTKTYGGTSWDYALSVQQTSDNGYIVAGRTNSFCIGYCDVWLLRTDVNGDTLWTRTYGGIDAEGARAVRETADGGYIITGWTYSFGAGESDIYLLKTDSKGDTLWTTTYGGPNYESSFSVQQTSEGSYVIAGYTCSYGAGESDVWLLKIAPDTLGVVEQLTQPVATALQINPNPFGTKVNIVYQIKNNSEVQIEIYDIAGRLIRNFDLQSEIPNGQLKISWDGTDNFGKKLPAGIYFVKLESSNCREVKKIVMLK